MIKNKNIYKPRYKIAFQAKSKIWAYKNSRLRRFFSIRGRWMYRCGSFRKNILVSNTIKWTVSRRFIKPYTRRIRSRKSKTRYKDSFYIKQQLRHFYGKLTEAKLRNIYKTHLISSITRNKSFFGALECRADMFFFRLRLLPTIYSCHQYVHHHGLIINNTAIEKSPNALIKIGDQISIPKIHWNAMYKYVLYRLFYRSYGKMLLKKRQYKLIKKKCVWLRKWIKKHKNKFYKWRNRRFKFKKKINKNIKKDYYKWKLIKFKLLRKIFHLYYAVLNLNNVISQIIIPKYQDNKIILNLCNTIYTFTAKFIHFFYGFRLKFKRFWFNIKKFLFCLPKFTAVTKKSRDYLDDHNTVISKYIYNKTVIETIKNKVKRRPRLLTLILSFLYITNLQLLDFNVDFYFKKSKLALLIKLDTASKEEMQTEEFYLTKELLRELIEELPIEIQKKRNLKIKHMNLYYSLYIRKLFRKINPRKVYFQYNKKKEKWIATGNNLLYFLINRRYKKKRKRTIRRLKKIHWFIPNYIYFDLHTLQAILLYTPNAADIIFPFRCSLLKIFSFYKSLGV